MHERQLLAARAAADVPVTEQMQESLKIFGDEAARHSRARADGDVAHKFNYAAVEFSAESVFRTHDADGSGSIDAKELEQILFDCGVKVTPDALRMARALLGLKKDGDTCTFESFDKWWKATYAKSRDARAALLRKLGKDVEEFLIPELKTLFAEFDVDCSGGLDAAEFAKFYPRLREFLGYPIPDMATCLREMDSVQTSKGENQGDGVVEYEEFETWFLLQEQKRLEAAAAAPI